MEAIRIWLNGPRNYQEGLKLYMAFGKDPLMRRLFSDPVQSNFKTKKLVSCLTEMLTQPNGKPAPIGGPKVIAQAATPEPFNPGRSLDAGWSKEMDEVESALHKQWKPLFSEMMLLCSQIGEVARQGKTYANKKNEAEQMAFRILDLDDQCDEIYARREHYLKNKSLPEEFPYGEPCKDPIQIPKKLANAERYVRRTRGKLEKDPSDVAAAEFMKKHQWFVDYYKKVLKLK